MESEFNRKNARTLSKIISIKKGLPRDNKENILTDQSRNYLYKNQTGTTESILSQISLDERAKKRDHSPQISAKGRERELRRKLKNEKKNREGRIRELMDIVKSYPYKNAVSVTLQKGHSKSAGKLKRVRSKKNRVIPASKVSEIQRVY